jgi:hypothetical protein
MKPMDFQAEKKNLTLFQVTYYLKEQTEYRPTEHIILKKFINSD